MLTKIEKESEPGKISHRGNIDLETKFSVVDKLADSCHHYSKKVSNSLNVGVVFSGNFPPKLPRESLVETVV